MNMSFFLEVKKLFQWTLANTCFYTYERWHLKTNVLWSNSLGALSKLLKLAAFSGTELPSTYTNRCKIYLEKNLKTVTMWMILCYTTSGLVVIYSSYKICPRGESSKKSFCRQAAHRVRAYPPSPPPYIQLFALSFVVHLTLEIDSMSLSQNVWIAVLQSHKKLQDGSQKLYEKMDFWHPSTDIKYVLSIKNQIAVQF